MLPLTGKYITPDSFLVAQITKYTPSRVFLVNLLLALLLKKILPFHGSTRFIFLFKRAATRFSHPFLSNLRHFNFRIKWSYSQIQETFLCSLSLLWTSCRFFLLASRLNDRAKFPSRIFKVWCCRQIRMF
jgi:hypothetical protein